MNSSFLNMAAASFLGTVFVVMSVSLVSEALFHTEAPEQEGFAIEVVEAAPEGDGGGEEAATPIAELLATADAAAGEASFRKCSSCHTVEEGGAHRVGPNLWDVVNRPIASAEGFGYSTALVEFSEGGEVVWSYDHLAGFLADPRGYVPGTAMSFAGLTREDELANVIAYLRTLSNDPAPLPEPGEVEEAAEAPAEGEGAEGDAAAADEAAGEDDTGEEPATEEDAAEGAGEAAAEGEAPAGNEAVVEEEPGAVDGAAQEEPASEGQAAPETEIAPADGAADDGAGDEADASADEAAPADEEGDAEPADEDEPILLPLE